MSLIHLIDFINFSSRVEEEDQADQAKQTPSQLLKHLKKPPENNTKEEKLTNFGVFIKEITNEMLNKVPKENEEEVKEIKDSLEHLLENSVLWVVFHFQYPHLQLFDKESRNWIPPLKDNITTVENIHQEENVGAFIPENRIIAPSNVAKFLRNYRIKNDDKLADRPWIIVKDKIDIERIETDKQHLKKIYEKYNELFLVKKQNLIFTNLVYFIIDEKSEKITLKYTSKNNQSKSKELHDLLYPYGINTQQDSERNNDIDQHQQVFKKFVEFTNIIFTPNNYNKRDNKDEHIYGNFYIRIPLMYSSFSNYNDIYISLKIETLEDVFKCIPLLYQSCHLIAKVTDANTKYRTKIVIHEEIHNVSSLNH